MENLKFDKENIDFNLIDNIVYSGRGVDIYIQSADYDGAEMTDKELDDLYEVAPDYAQESKFN